MKNNPETANGIKICPKCLDKMTSYEVPIEGILFKIPFTEIDVMWRRWNGKEWYCEGCSIDSHQERGREAYEAGKQEGYERAMEDNR